MIFTKVYDRHMQNYIGVYIWYEGWLRRYETFIEWVEQDVIFQPYYPLTI